MEYDAMVFEREWGTVRIMANDVMAATGCAEDASITERRERAEFAAEKARELCEYIEVVEERRKPSVDFGIDLELDGGERTKAIGDYVGGIERADWDDFMDAVERLSATRVQGGDPAVLRAINDVCTRAEKIRKNQILIEDEWDRDA